MNGCWSASAGNHGIPGRVDYGLGVTMIEFEIAVVPLVESLQGSNGKEIQRQLQAIFKQSEDDEATRSEWGKEGFRSK